MIRPTLGQALGPGFAGVLVGVTFPALGSTAVAALLGVGLVLLVAMRPERADRPVTDVDREKPHPLADLRDGFLFVLPHTVAVVEGNGQSLGYYTPVTPISSDPIHHSAGRNPAHHTGYADSRQSGPHHRHRPARH